ncbi:unnamed protein product [Scytosiphon promiscuus]
MRVAQSIRRQIKRERDTDPGKTGRTMRRGQLLVRFAREGRLRGIDQIVSRCPREEMLAWFVVRMFKGACLHNRLPTIVYMVDRGLDVEFHPVLEALHWVVEGCDEEQDGIDVVPTLNFLVTVAGMRPDQQRRSDFHTPLHVAIQRGLFEAARRLIELGADINAVAKVCKTRSNYYYFGVVRCNLFVPTREANAPRKFRLGFERLAGVGRSLLVITRYHLRTIRRVSGGDDHVPGRDHTSSSREASVLQRKSSARRTLRVSPRLAPQPSSSSSTINSRRRMRVAVSRARICGLLVERGARRTWRRGRSEAQVALDEKYRLLLLEGGGGRNLSTFNG